MRILLSSGWRKLLRRLLESAAILAAVIVLALFGLIMAERGRARVPAPVWDVAVEVLSRSVEYLTDHPGTYVWHRQATPGLQLLIQSFGRSAGLLLVSLGAAGVIGVTLGIAMALARRRITSALMLLLSILGVSTPSFLLAMFLWIVNIQIHRVFGIPVLPSTGFGWDVHVVMPALVLAARPLAQIAQITYVTLAGILPQEYIRTADAKGLSARLVLTRHALPNIRVPVLTTLGTSLRFSLASLPVVEFFFVWPGVGFVLLDAIQQGMTFLVTDLVVSLGLFFLLVNLALELSYPLFDPRLRGPARDPGSSGEHGTSGAIPTASERLAALGRWLHGLAGSWRRKPSPLPEWPASTRSMMNTCPEEIAPLPAGRRALRALMRNVTLLSAGLLITCLLVVAIAGPRMTSTSPYQVHGVMMVESVIGAPPFAPSTVFPWGTDHIGRDIQALVLAGGRQTLSLSLLGTVARVLLGTFLGLLAGWWRGGRLDRLVTSAVSVWAAFPVTLFAMILIQGLGIQQGMWVFVLTLCVVGWGEVAQFVRRQVISAKPELYVEAARSVGAGSLRILAQHIVPHLISPLLVMASLEMGAILMLLAELGFLGIFLGGGFAVQIAEGVRMTPIVAYFSDVPEWSAMLANIRDWWRSYPWMAWYPGVAFFLSILAFNLWGEGLRRFLDESRVNVARALNRYSVVVGVAAILVLVLLLRGSSAVGTYRSVVTLFDTQRAMAHVETLSSPAMEGRESGHAGANLAADYIAKEMESTGLLPAGEGDSYLQPAYRAIVDLAETPRLEILDDAGEIVSSLAYRRDFCEYASPYYSFGESTGNIVGLALGPLPSEYSGDPYRLRNLGLADKIVLLHGENLSTVNIAATAGALVVVDDPSMFQRRFLYVTGIGVTSGFRYDNPVAFITPGVADQLLASAGSSVAQLDAMAEGLAPGKAVATESGVRVNLSLPVDMKQPVTYHVAGIIPGSGAEVRTGPSGTNLDNQVIMVSAYYDGLGIGPDGLHYPSANDNASGVAAMLEIARAIKASPFQPKKSVMFVAWSGGERYDVLNVDRTMNARTGFNKLTVEAVLELSGIGAGEGSGIALGEGGSYRVGKVLQQAASWLGIETTVRGRGPHYGMPQGAMVSERTALFASLSWDGSDRTAHTTTDDYASIDPLKIESVGRTALLALSVLSRETNY